MHFSPTCRLAVRTKIRLEDIVHGFGKGKTAELRALCRHGISDELNDAVLAVDSYCWEMFDTIVFRRKRGRHVSYLNAVIRIPYWECGTESPETFRGLAHVIQSSKAVAPRHFIASFFFLPKLTICPRLLHSAPVQTNFVASYDGLSLALALREKRVRLGPGDCHLPTILSFKPPHFPLNLLDPS